jgi:hypothetical protein
MSSSVITQQSTGLATDTQPGLVGTGAQTFAGDKTFVNIIFKPQQPIMSGQIGTAMAIHTHSLLRAPMVLQVTTKLVQPTEA